MNFTRKNKPKITLYERLLGQKEPDIDSIDLSGIDTSNPYFAENSGMDEPTVKIATSQSPRVGGIIPDIMAGYKENRENNFDLNNLGNNTLADGRKKGFAYKLGEGMGSLNKFLDSPKGRGLLMAGIVGLTGGDGLQALTYGAGVRSGNLENRNRDAIYRQQLEAQGIDTSGLNGYITDSTYKNILDAKTLQDNAEYRKMYFENQKQQQEEARADRALQRELTRRGQDLSYSSNMANIGLQREKMNQKYNNTMNLSTADKKALSENQQTLTDIEAGLQLINENPKAYSLIKGSMPAWLTNRIDPKGISTRTQIDNITAVYRKWLTGAQMSDAERKAYERFLPAPTDNYETVKAKLEGMRASIARKNEIILNNAGLNVQQNDSVNDDPLGIL